MQKCGSPLMKYFISYLASVFFRRLDAYWPVSQTPTAIPYILSASPSPQLSLPLLNDHNLIYIAARGDPLFTLFPPCSPQVNNLKMGPRPSKSMIVTHNLGLSKSFWHNVKAFYSSEICEAYNFPWGNIFWIFYHIKTENRSYWKHIIFGLSGRWNFMIMPC